MGHGTDLFVSETLYHRTDLLAFTFLFYSSFISYDALYAVLYPSNKDFGFSKLLREIIS